jgi:predicted lipid-binding transport protein (Tim44 family)
MHAMNNSYNDQPSMPTRATSNLFLWVSGFGIGALIVLFGFVFLIGIGQLGHETISGPGSSQPSAANTAATPAAKSASNAPAAPGPAPKPAPNTAAPAVPETSGQAPAPANPNTPRAPTQGQR